MHPGASQVAKTQSQTEKTDGLEVALASGRGGLPARPLSKDAGSGGPAL